jgi:DNA (cytosine-5)-methyltransferase 1
MNYLSVCSGIEAATVAWHHMGWKPVGFSEIEKFPSQVLAHHYPHITNFGDMTKYKEWNINDTVGLLVGGTPCQSFSVAGLRKGLEDPRGNLALTYVGILDKFRPKWCIWENVPGVLSSGEGRDFGAFLGALAQLGYGFAYRVLDAQYFGVAQRRRRVFVVGCLGSWQSAAEVLFESDCLSGNIKKGRKTREEVTTSFVPSIAGTLDTECGGGKLSHQSATSGHIIPTFWDGSQVADTLTRTSDDQRMPDKNRFQAILQPAYSFDDHREGLRINKEKTNTLCAAAGTGGGNVPLTMAIQGNLIGRDAGGPNGIGVSDSNTMYTLTKTDVHAVAVGSSDISGTLRANPGSGWRSNGTPVEAVAIQNMAVRRLTEIECERLQGFPDNYTNIKENCPSGVRYKALGNSMAVPVMRWIGERINERL